MKSAIFPFSVATRLVLARVGAVTMFVVGVGCVAVGVWGLVGSWQAYGGAEPEILVCDDADQTVVVEPVITVAVSGAVVSPGMYDMDTNARIGDLLEAAGGISGDVDTLFVETQLNVAKQLVDGQGIYIPFAQDAEIVDTCAKLTAAFNATTHTSESTQSEDSQANQIISINSASQAVLDELPGIGEKRAEAIIAGRPYTSINELVERDILSESVFSDIEEMIQL